MKQDFPKVSKDIFCGLLGVSRQAHHQSSVSNFKQLVENEVVLEFVRRIRERQPRVGARKLYVHISEELTAKSGIKIGRDALFDLLREHGLLVRRRKLRPKTTDSGHHYRRYPNIVRKLVPTSIGELIVGDMTYVDTEEGFVFLFLLTDAYSHKVVGDYVGLTMEAVGAIAALQKAISQLPEGARPIHHSDRGVQYACYEYTRILEGLGIQISMTENGNPLENCMAERVNGLIKGLISKKFSTKLEAIMKIPELISIYNTEQKHGSIGMLTPEQAHQFNQPLKNHWKGSPSIASV